MLYALARKGAAPLLTLALILCAAHLQALALGRLIATALVPPPKGAPGAFSLPNFAPAATSPADLRQTSADRLLERNPFDSIRGSLLPSGHSESTGGLPYLQAPYAAPACEGVALLATAESADSRRSLAVLASANSHPRSTAGTPVRQGDAYRGKRVWFIAGDRVWLVGPQSLCQSTLFSKSPSAEPAKTALRNAPHEGPLSHVEPTGPDTFAIDRSLYDALPQIIMGGRGGPLGAVRVKPELEAKKLVGLRLQGVGPDSPLARLGLEDGDRLETINGLDLTADLDGLLGAYARLRTADQLRLTMTRRGKKVALSYVIR